MDFAFCPHCHQSVLDEDAEVCPFCGGSMQGGSKGSAPPPKPAATAKPASKSTSKDSKLLEEFPFEVEPRKLVAEFRVSPAPSKTRSLKVVCPMCDLTGYVPEAAAGKTVMCYNSSCPMPVFTAPIPEIPLPKPPPKPQRQSQPLVWGVGTFLVVSIIGGVVWWWAGQPQVDLVVKPLTPEDLQRLKSQQPVVNQPSETSPNEVPTTSAMPQREENTQPTPTLDYTAAVLRLIEPTVLQNNNNRSKPYCRRLAAETVALAGHPELSWGHLEQAVRLGPNVTFYRIPGLCEVFWQAYRHHQQEEARKALDAALSEVTHLPTFGRDRLELALKLAPPLTDCGEICRGCGPTTTFPTIRIRR
ncbi:MAG: hypothetical protein KatS3mg114_1106 [Planctomycetaceae bacterium]|nr:MAG: hypothetical protein KatS3mg114_1106 [Planctomycetaceae bacterium]